MSNFTVIEGEGRRDEIADLLRRYEKQWGNFLKLQEYEARRLKAVFDSLVAVGFTEDQALALTR